MIVEQKRRSMIRENDIKIPVESYSKKMVKLLKIYYNRVYLENNGFSSKANEKARIKLRCLIFPNEKEYRRDYQVIQDKCGAKTTFIFDRYTRCIMQYMGKLAECMIVDHCAKNSEFNRTCINIATFQEYIYQYNEDIEYDEYIPFLTSMKNIVYYTNGVWQQSQNLHYNPQDTHQDIGWCQRNNKASQLLIPNPRLLNTARIQIKTTINCEYLNIMQYCTTPIICFDVLNDFYKLKNRYPNNIIFSIRELSAELTQDMEKYFRILGAYITGIVDYLDIDEMDLIDDPRLKEMFELPINKLMNPSAKDIDVEPVLALAKQFERPIEISL